MITCPMCGKNYSAHDLEVHAKNEKVKTKYCCPHCEYNWNPAEVKKVVK